MNVQYAARMAMIQSAENVLYKILDNHLCNGRECADIAACLSGIKDAGIIRNFIENQNE